MLLTASVLAAATPAVQGATPQPATGGAAASSAHVTKVERIVPPRRKVVRLRFRPWDRPSPRRVRQIIELEAGRWHIPAARLARRVNCESHFQWAAGNGSYQGLLQFSSSTFYRGLRTIRSRRVAIARTRVHRVRETRLVHYSDGRVVRERGKAHRQKLVRLYRGTLPRRPGVYHGWVQLRIGAQAIRGISAVSNSEWGCPA